MEIFSFGKKPGCKQQKPLKSGSEQLDQYLSLLKGRNVAIVCNQTSRIGKIHLVDSLLSRNVRIVKLFAPEHGIRGQQDAGAHIKNQSDAKTGLPILSLYSSKKKKPSLEDLAGVDLVLFDIQDVGVRFYTFISSLHYVMEACAEQGKELIVLDRPNPNGHYIDGPVLDTAFRSFVGVDPIPIVYGMTIGELAKMIQGELWINRAKELKLTVIPCKNYHHELMIELPIKPSPNLPNSRAVWLYPSLCFFEGTEISLGRGTEAPFQIFGHPNLLIRDSSFTPMDKEGAMNPPQEGKKCFGRSLRSFPAQNIFNEKKIQLSYLLDAFQNFPNKDSFFLRTHFIDQLAGTDQLRTMILKGAKETEIRKSWSKGMADFKMKRKKYLIYP